MALSDPPNSRNWGKHMFMYYDVNIVTVATTWFLHLQEKSVGSKPLVQLAQLVERPALVWEAPGSMLGGTKIFFFNNSFLFL